MTRRRSHVRDAPCPACGRTVTRQHAIHLHGDVFHAHCVLYRSMSGDASRGREKEQMESR